MKGKVTLAIVGRHISGDVVDGRVCLVVSEELNRNMGNIDFWEPGSQKVIKTLCDDTSTMMAAQALETPGIGEQILFFLPLSDANAIVPVATPVMVREIGAISSAPPHRLRYLRNAKQVGMTFNQNTQLFSVYWWSNLYSPILTNPTSNVIPNSPIILLPYRTVVNENSMTYPNRAIRPHQPLRQSVSQTSQYNVPQQTFTATVPAFAMGVLCGPGRLGLDMRPNDTPANTEILSKTQKWVRAELTMVVARRLRDLDPPQPFTVSPIEGEARTEIVQIDDPNYQQPYFDPDYAGYPVNFSITVKADLSVNDVNQGQFLWSNTKDTDFELLPDAGQSTLTTKIGTLKLLQSSTNNDKVTLNITVQIDPTASYLTAERAALFIAAVQIQLFPNDPIDQLLVNNYYGDPIPLPIRGTLPLGKYEPHFNRIIRSDPQYDLQIGDVPANAEDSWAGILNGFQNHNTLQTGGQSEGKLFSPFQNSDAHKSLPSTPGGVNLSLTRQVGQNIKISAIQNELYRHTQNLYGHYELSSSRMSARAFMVATGRIKTYDYRENTPTEEINQPETVLKLGSGVLTNAYVQEQYVSGDSVVFTDTSFLFPYGSPISGTPILEPGRNGHQFQVTGGTGPYQYTIRPVRSAEVPIGWGEAGQTYFENIAQNENYPFGRDLNNLEEFGEPNDFPFPDTVERGGIPQGMYLNSTGLLFGRPLNDGRYLFRLHVKDSVGNTLEQTIRLTVLLNTASGEVCGQANQEQYPTTISYVDLPVIEDVTDINEWLGTVLTSGGREPKTLSIVSDNSANNTLPRSAENQVLLYVNTGKIKTLLTEDTFESNKGLWLIEVKADDGDSCDIFPVAWVVGTGEGSTLLSELPVDIGDLILEGKRTNTIRTRDFLILDPPKMLFSEVSFENYQPRGNVGASTRPDLGGIRLTPGPITTTVPGIITPVSLVGMGNSSPVAVAQSDFSLNDSASNYDSSKDVFDKITVPIPPPGTPDDLSLDRQTVPGKRIRTMWVT